MFFTVRALQFSHTSLAFAYRTLNSIFGQAARNYLLHSTLTIIIYLPLFELKQQHFLCGTIKSVKKLDVFPQTCYYIKVRNSVFRRPSLTLRRIFVCVYLPLHSFPMCSRGGMAHRITWFMGRCNIWGRMVYGQIWITEKYSSWGNMVH